MPWTGFGMGGGIALAAGWLGVRGFPPDPEPLWMVGSMAILLRLLAATPPENWRRAAWFGWLFGVGQFTFGMTWLLTSLHVYGSIPLPLSWMVLVFLAGFLAIYPGLFAASLVWLDPVGQRQWLLAPVLWMVGEWLRSWILTGFAWNLIGYVWSGQEAVEQVADLGGVWLLSWLTVTWAALLAGLLHRDVARRRLVLSLLALVSLGGGAYFYGQWRLHEESPPPESPLRVALIQGNIPQQTKWDPANRQTTIDTYVGLSRSVRQPVDLVIWPETAVPFLLQFQPAMLKQVIDASQEIGAPILVGMPTADLEGDEKRYYNSMVLLEPGEHPLRRYNKHHLVPFGEYLPLRQFMPDFLKTFTEATSDFSPGDGPEPLAWPGGDLGPLICYEAVPPGEVRQLARTGVRWLVNITNDAWFGPAARPQHLAMARMRAIENRLPLIRVANTGITAVFDHMGRELGRIDADRREVLIVATPPGPGRSLYREIGDGWLLVILLASVSWCWLRRKPGHRTNLRQLAKFPVKAP